MQYKHDDEEEDSEEEEQAYDEIYGEDDNANASITGTAAALSAADRSYEEEEEF